VRLGYYFPAILISPAGKEAKTLILTRRPSESLIIESRAGKRIEVTAQEVKGNQVRIGMDGPDDVSIVREELAEKVST